MTSHGCDGSNCDRDGVVQELYFHGTGNSTHVQTDFLTTGGALSSVEQTISWNGRQQVLRIKNDTSMAQMNSGFANGMVLVMSIWTNGPGGMFWLNGACASAYATDLGSIYGTFTNLAVSDL